MNMKKIVSAASALTIAASAFASMGIVANASAYTNPYTATDSEVLGTVYIGTADAATKTVTPETFDGEGYADGGNFDKSIPTRDSGIAADTADVAGKNQYGTGKGIAINTGKNSKDTYTFKTPVTTGKLVLRGDFADTQRNEFVEIIGEDAEGNSISVFKIAGGNGTTCAINVYNNGEAVSQSKNTMKWRESNGLTVSKVVVDLTGETPSVDWAYDGIKASNNNLNNHSGNYTVNGLVKITAIAFGNENDLRIGTKPTFDNVALYNVIPDAAALDYSIVAKAGDVELQTLATGQAKPATGYGVTGIPEVIEKDGAYYRLDSSVINHSVSYTMGDQEVANTVKYNLDETIVAYIEGEDLMASGSGNAIYTDEAYSDGKAQTIMGDRNLNTTINLAESGEYSLVVGQGARASSKNQPYTGAVNIDDTKLGSLTGTTSGIKVETMPNAMIAAGSHTLSVAVEYSAISPIDYIIIKKVGDYVAPVVDPTATRKQLYSGTTATDNTARDNGSAWLVTVTPGTNAIDTLGVSIDGTAGDKTIETSIFGEGKLTFAVVVNKIAAQITSFNVLADDTTVEATVTE